MTQETKDFVKSMLADCGGNAERLARHLRDNLRIGGIKTCRALILQALDDHGEGCDGPMNCVCTVAA